MSAFRIAPGETVRVQTGIAVCIPEGFVGLIRDRSSMGARGIHVAGGVIDWDYRGEVLVCLTNTGWQAAEFAAGDRIAQMLVLPCFTEEPQEVQELPSTQRGAGGFGSTGK